MSGAYSTEFKNSSYLHLFGRLGQFGLGSSIFAFLDGRRRNDADVDVTRRKRRLDFILAKKILAEILVPKRRSVLV